MKLRVTALIFAPGFALVGSLAGGWVGAAGGLGVWLLLVGAATVAHLMIARATLPAEQRDPPFGNPAPSAASSSEPPLAA